MARLVRAQFRSLREIGFRRRRAQPRLFADAHHRAGILPNALPPVIVAASVMIANAILTEAGLAPSSTCAIPTW